jgi:hypothetical protein
MRAAGGAPESQSRVYRLYGLCCAGGAPESGSVRRWVGGCRGRWGREMGMVAGVPSVWSVLRRWYASGAPESGSVRRWVGGCRGRWGREMGMGGDLLPRTSGLGVLLNNPQV